MPRWHSWRPSAIAACHAMPAAGLAAPYKSTHKWRGWRDRENQLIYFEAVACHRGDCTLAEFHQFARMVIDHKHPDIVACHAIDKMSRPALERMTSASVARDKVDKARASIDHVTLADLFDDDDDV